MASREERAALAAAKEKLIREGELYRLTTLRSKYEVAHALQPQALLHGAVDHALGLLQGRLGGMLSGQGGGLSGANLKTILPYALTLGSWVVRKRMLKPALVVGALAAAGVYWLLRRQPKP